MHSTCFFQNPQPDLTDFEDFISTIIPCVPPLHDPCFADDKPNNDKPLGPMAKAETVDIHRKAAEESMNVLCPVITWSVCFAAYFRALFMLYDHEYIYIYIHILN